MISIREAALLYTMSAYYQHGDCELYAIAHPANGETGSRRDHHRREVEG